MIFGKDDKKEKNNYNITGEIFGINFYINNWFLNSY